MSHAVSDAVMMPTLLCPHLFRFHLGLQFRAPSKAPAESLLVDRYVRIQVASPPPARFDGSNWWTGLQRGGHDIDPRKTAWENSEVVPVEGISPLGQPSPETLVYDEWRTVAREPAQFIVTPLGEPSPASEIEQAEIKHIVSVAYPPPAMAGKQSGEVAVDYSGEYSVRFARAAEDWIAVSFDRFWPPGRGSADYIIPVGACPTGDDLHEAAVDTIGAPAAT